MDDVHMVSLVCDTCDEYIVVKPYEDASEAIARHSQTPYHLEIAERFRSIKLGDAATVPSNFVSSSGDAPHDVTALPANFIKSFAVFFCRLCQTNVNDSAAMSCHMNSDKHLMLESFVRDMNCQRELLKLVGFSRKQTLQAESNEILLYFSNMDSKQTRTCLVCNCNVFADGNYLLQHTRSNENHLVKLNSLFMNWGVNQSFYCVICNVEDNEGANEHCGSDIHRNAIELLLKFARHDGEGQRNEPTAPQSRAGSESRSKSRNSASDVKSLLLANKAATDEPYTCVQYRVRIEYARALLQEIDAADITEGFERTIAVFLARIADLDDLLQILPGLTASLVKCGEDVRLKLRKAGAQLRSIRDKIRAERDSAERWNAEDRAEAARIAAACQHETDQAEARSRIASTFADEVLDINREGHKLFDANIKLQNDLRRIERQIHRALDMSLLDFCKTYGPDLDAHFLISVFTDEASFPTGKDTKQFVADSAPWQGNTVSQSSSATVKRPKAAPVRRSVAPRAFRHHIRCKSLYDCSHTVQNSRVETVDCSSLCSCSYCPDNWDALLSPTLEAGP